MPLRRSLPPHPSCGRWAMPAPRRPIRRAVRAPSGSPRRPMDPLSDGPEPAGWYSGDMHVHRSCGGSPVPVSTIYDAMVAQDLDVVSLLADMGNGEVQDPITDLPLVTGAGRSDLDARANRPLGRRMALGRHLHPVPPPGAGRAPDQPRPHRGAPDLGRVHLSDRAVGASAGGHLRVRAHAVPRDGVPQSLNCCIPVEYPVEVALGGSGLRRGGRRRRRYRHPGLLPPAELRFPARPRGRHRLSLRSDHRADGDLRAGVRRAR